MTDQKVKDERRLAGADAIDRKDREGRVNKARMVV